MTLWKWHVQNIQQAVHVCHMEYIGIVMISSMRAIGQTVWRHHSDSIFHSVYEDIQYATTVL